MNKLKPRNKICFQNNENIHANLNLKSSRFRTKKWNIFRKTIRSPKEWKPENKPRFFQKRLFQKQQFKNFYGCLPEYQLKNIVQKLKKKKNKIHFFQECIRSLETRLDVVVFRLHLAKTIFHAKQLINHNKICVNNQIISKSNYMLKPGDIILRK